MRVILARTAGFCMGVRRAMEIAQDAAREEDEIIYSYGPLIHNAQAVEVLERQGVKAVREVSGLTPGKIVIRAHGIGREEKDTLEKAGFSCLDATCPHVLRSQQRIAKAANAGKNIILVGDVDHAETIGLAGHADTEVIIISSTEEAQALNPAKDFCVIAQTTFNAELYKKICEILQSKNPECLIFDSICRATHDRQQEARQIAQSCDALIVVGGKHSANTLRLAEIGKNTGKPTFHIETAEELDLKDISQYKTVGITAGASTPGWLTQTVIDRLDEVSSSGFRARMWKLLTFAIRSYIYSALGAVCLAYVVTRLLGTSSMRFACLTIIFSYILSVYIFNRYATASSSKEKRSALPSFYKTHKRKLYLLLFLLTLSSFSLAWQVNYHLIPLLALSYIGGIIYTVPIMPAAFKYRRLLDIPASKDFFVSLAWVVVVVGIPAIAAKQNLAWNTIIWASTLVFLLAFGKTVSLDLRDTEGDRLIGTESIPVLIGKKKTIKLLYLVQTAALVLSLILTANNIFHLPGFALAPLPIYGLAYLQLFRKRLLTEEIRCQAIVDGQFLFAGFIVFLWNISIYV